MKLAELFVRLGVQADTAKLGEFEKGMKNVKTGMAAVAAVAGVITYAMGSVVKEIASLGDEIDETSEKLGMNAEAYQELAYAVEQTGGTAGNLQMAVKTLSKAMDDAATGGKAGLELFSRLGLEYKNADGSLRPFEDVLGEVADRFSEMEDPQRKAALATELFGRSGMDMIPLLNQGSDGIEALKQRARDLGIVMGGDTVKQAGRFNDKLNDVSKAATGLKIRLYETLGTTLEELLDKYIFPTIIAFNEWNKQTGFLTNAVKSLGYALAIVGAALAAWSIGTALAQIAKLITALTAAGNAGLWATVKFLAIPILVGAGFAALILIMDELNAYFRGADSLLGRFLERHEILKAMVDTFGQIGHHLALIVMALKWLATGAGFTETSKEMEDAVMQGIRKRGFLGMSFDRYSQGELSRMQGERQTEQDIAGIQYNSTDAIKTRVRAKMQAQQDAEDQAEIDAIKARVRGRLLNTTTAPAAPGEWPGAGGAGAGQVNISVPMTFNNLPTSVPPEEIKQIVRDEVSKKMDDTVQNLRVNTEPTY